MGTLMFLIVFPAVISALLLLIKSEQPRALIVTVGGIIIAAASVVAAIQFAGAPAAYFEFESSLVDFITMFVGFGLAIYIFVKAFYAKKTAVMVLAALQLLAGVIFELFFARGVTVVSGIYIDLLSIVLVLIIGLVGSGIIIYAIGYMRDYVKNHPNEKDRRPIFFSVMFIFLSGMYIIVLSNNMAWMLCGWEITTVCSFALIGYTGTPEAVKNSFTQIWMNLIGGIAFTTALIYVAGNFSTLSFVAFIEIGQANPQLVVLPVTLFALAGFTKNAMMPFHKWLLGAMVAPTPTSALLHSSAMVKAGIFLLIKISPLMGLETRAGQMVSLVGGITFLLCAIQAITVSDAKRVLAYSTISNLGLIVALTGVATSAAIWAAIFLTIFHATAKSLLFLTVGTAQNKTGSRDIEGFDGLLERMPSLARFMSLGIVAMFIAPFGMLVSKWAAIQALIESGSLILILLIAFGSAATFFFWVKWLGKISAVCPAADNQEEKVSGFEWSTMSLMAILTVAATLLFPLISTHWVVPYLHTLGSEVAPMLESSNLWIMSIIALVVLIVPILTAHNQNTPKKDVTYLSGLAITNNSFRNSLEGESVATQRNWYMNETFDEEKISRAGIWLNSVLIFSGVGYALFALSIINSLGWF